MEFIAITISCFPCYEKLNLTYNFTTVIIIQLAELHNQKILNLQSKLNSQKILYPQTVNLYKIFCSQADNSDHFVQLTKSIIIIMQE